MQNVLLGALITLAIAGCATNRVATKTTTTSGMESTPTSSGDAVAENATLPPTRAQAVLKAGKDGKVKGLIHFTAEDGNMKIETMVEGLKPGPHGFHIHEVGDCSKADFSSAGGHFHVQSSTHGSLNSAKRHAGDLGNLTANNKGVAKMTVNVDGLSFAAGPNNIIGKSIVIHQDKDDFKSQPAGNSGARIACGVIQGL